jgi:hypothetical protein
MTNEVMVTVSEEINKLHENILLSAKSTLDLVVMIGEKLVEVKEELPHGTFQTWVNRNCNFTVRTAQNYMKVFLRRDEVEQVEDLSSAYALLENKRIKPEEEKELIEPKFDETPDEFYYWPEFVKCADVLHRAYDKLADKRDHTTPLALSNFIGNLKDMATRIRTWDPEERYECTKCNGTGMLDGKPCEWCIEGMSGKFTKSVN